MLTSAVASRPPPPQRATAATLQVGQVVTAQPSCGAYAGAYGGSFSGPRASSGLVNFGAAGTGSQSIPVALPQPMVSQQGQQIRRLNSQHSSASLSMQPALQPSPVGTATMPVATVVSAPQVSSRGLPAGLPAAYTAVISGANVAYTEGVTSLPVAYTEGVTSLGAAEAMSDEQEKVLMQTRMLRQGCSDELVQAEVESLRRSVAAQEDRILQLTKQLQGSQDNERKLATDLEAARKDAGKLFEELQLERLVREQAEAAATELRLAAEMAAQAATSQDKVSWQRPQSSPERPTTGRSGSTTTPGRRPRDADRGTARGKNPSSDVRATPQSNTPIANNASVVSGGLASSRQGSSQPQQPQSAKDEIDGRLHEFIERSDCGLLFRRLNRGWYSFRRQDERGPQSSDRSVEISIVNGKLMAKLEPSTHDAGWNNGKLGTVERFCHCMMSV